MKWLLVNSFVFFKFIKMRNLPRCSYFHSSFIPLRCLFTQILLSKVKHERFCWKWFTRLHTEQFSAQSKNMQGLNCFYHTGIDYCLIIRNGEINNKSNEQDSDSTITSRSWISNKNPASGTLKYFDIT